MNDRQSFEINISAHAMKRAQQRGVDTESIQITALYGESTRAIGGAMRRTMTSRTIKKMARKGFSIAKLEKCKGTVLMTVDNDIEERLVLTVRPTEKSGKRRGGRHKPKHGDGRISALPNPHSKVSS